MTVSIFNVTNGMFSGTGVYNSDSTYTWDVTGTVSGNDITFHLVYTGTGAGYYSDAIGTITSATSMNGTWIDSSSQSGTWTGNGTATVVPTAPTDKNQCKKDGWKNLVHPDGSPFKNQGDCVSFVASNGKAGGDH